MDFRLFARIVGIFGMAFSVIAAVVFAVLFILSVLFSDEAMGILFGIANQQTRRFNESSQDIILITMQIVLVFAFLISLIQVFASCHLIEGTKEDVDSRKRIRCCVTWRKITLLFLSAMTLQALTWFSDDISWEAIFSEVFAIIINVGALFVVSQHIKQLSTTPPTYSVSGTYLD